MKGEDVDVFPPLDPWIKGLLVFQWAYIVEKRAAGEPTATAGTYLDNPAMVRQLIREPALPFFRELLLAQRDAVRATRRTGEEARALPRIGRDVRVAGVRASYPDLPEAFVDRVAGVVDDAMTGAVLDLSGEIVAAVIGTAPTRKAHRPKDMVTRAFFAGVRHWFKQNELGEPSAADLADLALVGGLERGRFDSVREAWRKRRKKLVEESP